MISRALDRLIRALDAAFEHIAPDANALNGAEDEDTERPKWVDLFGIDPDYTDGKPVDQWLDEQRGEA